MILTFQGMNLCLNYLFYGVSLYSTWKKIIIKKVCVWQSYLMSNTPEWNADIHWKFICYDIFALLFHFQLINRLLIPFFCVCALHFQTEISINSVNLSPIKKKECRNGGIEQSLASITGEVTTDWVNCKKRCKSKTNEKTSSVCIL